MSGFGRHVKASYVREKHGGEVAFRHILKQPERGMEDQLTPVGCAVGIMVNLAPY